MQVRARKMTQQLKLPTAFSEDLSMVPSVHGRQITTTYNSSLKIIPILLVSNGTCKEPPPPHCCPAFQQIMHISTLQTVLITHPVTAAPTPAGIAQKPSSQAASDQAGQRSMQANFRSPLSLLSSKSNPQSHPPASQQTTCSVLFSHSASLLRGLNRSWWDSLRSSFLRVNSFLLQMYSHIFCHQFNFVVI